MIPYLLVIAVWIQGITGQCDSSMCPQGSLCVLEECTPSTWDSVYPQGTEGGATVHERRKRAVKQRCDPGYFDCDDGLTCAIECDGVVECPDGEDESNCIGDCECAIHPGDRVRCEGYPGVRNSTLCLEMGCCWDHTNHRGRSPKCFQQGPSVLRKKSRMCSPILHNSLRENCGWKGISDNDCHCRSCCCPPKVRRTYWCYTPKVCKIYSVENATSITQATVINGNYTLLDDLTCAGPHGGETAVYQHDVNTFVYLYYVQENREWLLGGNVCNQFFGARWPTDHVVPDAEQGGWDEHHDEAWQPSPLIVTCLEYNEL